MTKLDSFEPDNFLRDYWQKKPLFIKNPWREWCTPLEPDELAGLACEDNIESRLVVQKGEGWEVEHGPFPENRFGSLGNRQWTLLVQAVDHYAPTVAELLQPFRFIPNWRIDDIMVSYAAEEGGVGAHFDQYDVFLIQGSGKRRWQIGEHCDENSPLIPNDGLKLLAEFQPTQEWICEPGDILYIPPGISHNGVAVGQDCMTYSIGFRAPSKLDLVSHWVDEPPEDIDNIRYSDQDLQIQQNPGEILPRAIDRLHNLVGSELADREDFAEWFGRYNSAPKYPDIDWSPEKNMSTDDLSDAVNAGQVLVKNPASRFSFIQNRPNTLTLFVDGEMIECEDDTVQLAQHICAANSIQAMIPTNSVTAYELLTLLYNQGSLYLMDDSYKY